MKNSLLCAALLSLMCTQAQADNTPQTTNQPPTTNGQTTPAGAVVVPTNQPTVQSGQLPTVTPSSVQPTSQPTITGQPQPATVINCEYKIPAETKVIDKTLVLNWSEKATLQAFDFDATTLDGQLLKLQPCFTEQGWTGFNTALQKSGNLEAIKTQKLHVSSKIDGQTQITDVTDNQWKIAIPLQVLYQNDKEKVTQLLNVNLTIGRKTSGDLGIVQIIATPRPSTSRAAPNPINHQVTASVPASNATVPSNPDDESNTDNTNNNSTAPAASDSNANTNANTAAPTNNDNNEQPAPDSTNN